MTRVLALPDLAHAAAEWRREGAVIVLAAGCFDPLHLGHVQHLEAAKKLGISPRSLRYKMAQFRERGLPMLSAA